MGAYRNEHRRLAHRGGRFHFISYEAQDADPKTKTLAAPAMWYLESSGSRWPAIPQLIAQPEAELETQLAAWLEAYVFAVSPPPPALPDAPPRPYTRPEWIGAAPN
jgi:hypothetical protein